MLGLLVNCTTAALTTAKKVSPNRKQVKLMMIDFSDRTRTCIPFLKLAADNIEKLEILDFSNPIEFLFPSWHQPLTSPNA